MIQNTRTITSDQVSFQIQIHKVRKLLNVAMIGTFVIALSILFIAQATLSPACSTKILSKQTTKGNSYYRLSDGTGFWSPESFNVDDFACPKSY
jgi:hypothetical protein